ncbi:MAG: hypothetical protein K5981_07445 [Clostridia bacterium]|nr:hypothetical protein [Clostridia bacterium]
MIRKILIFIIAMAVLLSVSAFSVYAKLPEIIVFPEEPTPIRTAEELNAIRNGNFGYYILEEDIDLSEWEGWEPINCPAGGSHHALCIRFNGNNHTISGLNGTGGLFGTVSYAEIWDLSVQGEIDSKDGQDAGGIIARAESESQYGEQTGVWLTNCSFSGTITVSLPGTVKEPVNAAGGLIGYAESAQDGRGGRSEIVIRDCYANVTVCGCMRYAGGIAGYVGVSQNGNPAADTKAQIERCSFYAEIDWKPSGAVTGAAAERCGGGLIGLAETIGTYSGEGAALCVSNCGDGSGHLSDFVQAGGLIGVLRGEGHFLIDGCGTEMKISAASDRYGCYGGMAGLAEASGGGTFATFSNRNTYGRYYGSITVDAQEKRLGEETPYTFAGGLIGLLKADAGTAKIELDSADSGTGIFVQKSSACRVGQLVGAFCRGEGVTGFLSSCVPYAHSCVYSGEYEDKVNEGHPFIGWDEYGDVVFEWCYSQSFGEDVNIGSLPNPSDLYAQTPSVQRFPSSVETIEQAPNGWIPVTSLSDLQAIGASGGSFILMRDLTAEGWDPSAKDKEASGMITVEAGTSFNGNGFCLRGVDIAGGGTVKNLGMIGGRLRAERIENCWHDGDVPGAYAFAAEEIENCVNYAGITDDASWWGETASCCAPFEGQRVRSCVNYADVIAAGTCGGIVSRVEGAAGRIEDCVNYGTITVTASKTGGSFSKESLQDVCAGGIAAIVSAHEYAVTGCRNCGSVTIAGSSKTAAVAGGLIGELRCEETDGKNYDIRLDKCFSEAKSVSASADGCAYAGGLIGRITADTNLDVQVDAIDCETYADAAASSKNGSSAASCSIGAISAEGTGTAAVSLTNCAIHGNASPDAGTEALLAAENCLLDTDGRTWTTSAGQEMAEKLDAYAKANSLMRWGCEKSGRPTLNRAYAPQTSIASGVLDPYFIATSGSPVAGEHCVVWDGEHFFVCQTTADRKVKSFWFSPEGELLYSETLADLSETKGNLSQPSACVWDGVVYVGYVAMDKADDDTCGVQYLCTTAYGRKMITNDVIVASNVWPRKPAMAACKDGIMLVWRNEQTKCFAGLIRYSDLKLATSYQVYKDEWDEYGGSFAIYPSIAYAPESGVFLAAWDAGSTIRGAILTTETKDTPESFEIMSADYCDLDQPRTASDGRNFCVLSHVNGGGIMTSLVDAKGNAGNSVLTADGNGCTAGQIEWDGKCWLITWSQSRTDRYYSNQDKPDFRHVDCYMRRLDAKTLKPVSVTAGIATEWWHQYHNRFALDGDGHILCVWIEAAGGDTQTQRWCLLNGLPVIMSSRELRSSGLAMRCVEDPGTYGTPYLTASDGQTAYASFGALYKRTFDTDWTKIPGTACDGNYFGMDEAGGTVAICGWSGLVGTTLGLSSGDGSSFNLDEHYDAVGSIPATDVYVADAGSVYVCTAEGKIWRKDTQTKKTSCVYTADEGSLDFHCIDGNSAKDIYAGGDRGMLVHYDGKAWTQVETPYCVCLNAVWADGAGGAYVTGDSGVILRVEKGEVTDSWMLGTFNLQAVWGLNDHLVFACGDQGTVLYYDGSEWMTVACERPADDESGDPLYFMDLYGLTDGKELVLYAMDVMTNWNGYYELRMPLPAEDEPLFTVKRSERKVMFSPRGDQLRSSIAIFAAYDEDGRFIGLACTHSGTVEVPGKDEDITGFYVTNSFVPLCEEFEVP